MGADRGTTRRSGSTYVAVGGGFRVGVFRCAPGDPRWATENRVDAPHVVFPGPPVGITQAGREPLVATPNEVVLYNRDTSYHRRLLTPQGDHSVLVDLDDELADAVDFIEAA